ncbi:MAG: GyrI-like domain-containing protein [Chlorobiaceae bacterium]|nr:GyrI-like domain-containing protein [Chlorobiaceae bacterium]
MDFECQFVCELKELASVPALVIREHAAVSEIGSLFDAGFREISRVLEGQGRQPAPPSFARFYALNDGMLDVEFGYPVDAEVRGSGRAVIASTPSGKAASCLYIGPYAEIEPAYTALMKWIEENGLVMNGEAYELYLDDPFATLPDQLRTQIHLLLRDD